MHRQNGSTLGRSRSYNTRLQHTKDAQTRKLDQISYCASDSKGRKKEKKPNTPNNLLHSGNVKPTQDTGFQTTFNSTHCSQCRKRLTIFGRLDHSLEILLTFSNWPKLGISIPPSIFQLESKVWSSQILRDSVFPALQGHTIHQKYYDASQKGHKTDKLDLDWSQFHQARELS